MWLLIITFSVLLILSITCMGREGLRLNFRLLGLRLNFLLLLVYVVSSAVASFIVWAIVSTAASGFLTEVQTEEVPYKALKHDYQENTVTLLLEDGSEEWTKVIDSASIDSEVTDGTQVLVITYRQFDDSVIGKLLKIGNVTKVPTYTIHK